MSLVNRGAHGDDSPGGSQGTEPVRVLNGVASGTSTAIQQASHRLNSGEAPSLHVPSAEGITTYAGLNGDAESTKARDYIRRRKHEIRRLANS
jgi:hypothetical protein